MHLSKSNISPIPRKYVLYLPKKFRYTANVDLDGIELEHLKQSIPQKYNELLQNMKSNANDEMIFVDIYKNNFVFFNYKKWANIAKQQVFQKTGYPIKINKIVITDIDTPQTSSIYEDIHQPCHNYQNYTDYPATYTF
jgi:hypothetical protein